MNIFFVRRQKQSFDSHRRLLKYAISASKQKSEAFLTDLMMQSAPTCTQKSAKAPAKLSTLTLFK